MPALPGDHLTELQRNAQGRIAAQVALQIARNFRSVSTTDIAGQRNFIEASIPLVIQANRLSAASARDYATQMSVLEGGGRDRVDLAPPPSIEQVRTSLRVTGPLALSQRTGRIQSPLDQPAGRRLVAVAKSQSTAGVAGAAVRQAMSGGRDTIEGYADQPKGQRVRGYVRITRNDDKVCYFCAMLASRANWLSDSFEEANAQFIGPGTAKVHDSCRCILRPVYGSVLPEQTWMYRRAWAEFSGGDKGAIQNFRSGWEKRSADWDSAAA